MVGDVLGDVAVSELCLVKGVESVGNESMICICKEYQVVVTRLYIVTALSTIIPVSVLIVVVVGVGGVELKNLTSARWTH